jgi:hypothetical protein
MNKIKIKIFVIQGFIGSGKDTFGNLLIEKYGGAKLSFAGTLKDLVSILFDWDRELLEGSTIKSREWRETKDEWWSEKLGISNLTPRWVLQNIGTDLFRDKFHKDIWLLTLENKIRKSSYKNIVITDCRFPNEINFLKSMGATFIRIKRGEDPEWVKNYIENNIIPNGIHSSEYLWLKNNFDYIIENNDSIEILREKLLY